MFAVTSTNDCGTWWTRPLFYRGVERTNPVVNQTTISAQKNEQGNVVVTDETTGIQVESDNRPIALRTLAEKLEIELLSESGRSRE